MDSSIFQVSYVALWILVILHSLILLGVIRLLFQLQSTGGASSKVGLSAGIAAPAFTASDLRGIAIRSSQFAGRRWVLLFVSPGCPECNDALNDMSYLMGKADGNAIVVCRASRDECLRLTEKHTTDIPVIADEDDKISRQYRVVLVPTAVLIDEEARIASYGIPGELEERDIASHGAAPPRHPGTQGGGLVP